MTPPLITAIIYVTNDQYYLMSMASCVMIGLFISAAIYDGETKEIKKFLISLGVYAFLILLTTYARVMPNMDMISPTKQYMTFAGMVTLLSVTIFYLIGMTIGVIVTRLAHRKKEVK